MKDFSKNILGKIKKEKILPIPKWNFVFKKSFIWILFVISVALGGFAFGSILEQIRTMEWDIHPRVTTNLASFIFLTLPYLWILFMLGFSILAYYYLRHTSKGYRYNTILIINSSVLISVLFGTALYATRISEKIENSFQENIPFYREIIDPRARIWNAPEKGLLAGKIIKIINQEELNLEDLEKQIWTIDFSNASTKKTILLQEEMLVKIIGQQNGELFFIAEEIRPWGHMMPNVCPHEINELKPCLEAPMHFQKKMKENFESMRNM